MNVFSLNKINLSREELFAQYKSVMEVWTEGDSLNGQTRSIMKKRAFFVVRVLTYDLKL